MGIPFGRFPDLAREELSAAKPVLKRADRGAIMASVAEFRVLGPVEAVIDGEAVSLPAAKPRALLAVLLLNRNRVVSVSQLIDDLWSEEPPDTATKALQVYVSQLRKAIGADRVLTKPPGYSLRVGDGELDLDVFERLVADGRERLASGDAEGAADRLRQALELWRGPALAEFRAEPFARDAGARLEESQLAAVEDRIEAELALGRHDRLIPELEELVRRHPFRERLRGQLMLALYRSGRQADALDLYRRTREALVDELGIEPGPALQELEQAILRQDRALGGGRTHRAPDAAAVSMPGRRRRVLLGLAVAVVVAAVAAVAAVVITRGGSSGGSSDAELRTFVSKVENFLVQSRDDRRQVAATVAAAFECRLQPHAAALRLNRVQRGRQSLLQQIAALSVPDREAALRASDLLQKAAHASITADWHYRDWLLGRKRCGPPDASPDLRAAAAASAAATRTKKAFLTVFDPLARRFGQRVWTVGEF
jgi:DNA-binding SARP family transcriptional activator